MVGISLLFTLACPGRLFSDCSQGWTKDRVGNWAKGHPQCEDILGWEDADGMTCDAYASEGWCAEPPGLQVAGFSHYDLAVNGVSVYEACGASCPELCGESFSSIIVLYTIAAIEPISDI